MRFIGGIPREERQEINLTTPTPVREWYGRVCVPIALMAWTLALMTFPASAAAGSNELPNEAVETASSASISMPQLVNSPLQPIAPDYSRSTDHELTRLGARWDALSAPEREALLREVKLRMAQRKDADGVLMIHTQRRYGRVYRGNGQYLKIETKVIRVRPSAAAGTNTAGFGTGFEQRNAESGETEVESPPRADETSPPLDAALSPPVMRASDPSS